MNFLPVQQDLAAFHVVEMRNQVADRCLSAAAGSDQGKLGSLRNVQIHVPQHALVLVVGIAHVSELNVSLQFSGGFRALRVPFRFRVHNLAEAFKPRHAVFKLFHKVDQRHHRADEHINGNNERGIVAELNLPVIQEETAGNQHHHVENVRHKRIPAVKPAHGAVGIPAGSLEFPVPFLKLFLLLVRVGEGLGHPDTADAVFKAGVDFRHGRTGVPKGLAHFLAQRPGNHDQERHARENDQRQPNVDRHQVNEGNHDAQHRNDQVFRPVVRKLADVEQVVRHPAHDLARLVVVVKAVGQFFQVVKHIAAHLRLHVNAHHMPLILNEIVQHHLGQIQCQQRHPENQDHPVIPVRNQRVEHCSGNDGVNNADQRNQHGGAHIHEEQLFVRLVILDKPPDQPRGLLAAALFAFFPRFAVSSHRHSSDAPFSPFSLRSSPSKNTTLSRGIQSQECIPFCNRNLTKPS